MNYPDGIAKIAGHRARISEIREEMRKVQAEMKPQEVEDYVFQTLEGEKTDRKSVV